MITIGVVSRLTDVATVDAYLYGGVTDTGETHATFLPDKSLRFFEAVDLALAEYQAGRFSSGLFGARVCSTEAEKLSMIEEFRP